MKDSEKGLAEPLPPRSTPHIKLFIPGPTEVAPDVLDAQGRWMIGHRMPECADLIATVQPKLRQVFLTEKSVFISVSSGSGLLEAAVRNCSDRKTLNCVNGAFSDRWRLITESNGKQNEVLEVEWGQPILPEMVSERLTSGTFDALTVAHNETSTGVCNPIQEIVSAVRQAPNGHDITVLVDSVSGLAGARLEFDAWDLDVAVTSSQKALALPPGLAFCAVSDRAMDRAKHVANRGYYFDFLTLAKYLERNQTPATPAISLLFALDRQLTAILDEGMERRFERHLRMRDRTIEWATERGFSPFAAPGYQSPTVTCLSNDRKIDVKALNEHLRRNGMILSDGYGTRLKGKTFRIAHMGQIHLNDLEELFAAVDRFLQ